MLRDEHRATSDRSESARARPLLIRCKSCIECRHNATRACVRPCSRGLTRVGTPIAKILALRS